MKEIVRINSKPDLVTTNDLPLPRPIPWNQSDSTELAEADPNNPPVFGWCVCCVLINLISFLRNFFKNDIDTQELKHYVNN